jgi:hypothetical protein
MACFKSSQGKRELWHASHYPRKLMDQRSVFKPWSKEGFIFIVISRNEKNLERMGFFLAGRN